MKYGTILADPPWQYGNSGCRGAAANQYATMTDREICELPIATLAADDCVLVMWATWPKLVEALDVVDAWGFRYVSAFPWVKVTSVSSDLFGGDLRFEVPYGVGFWARGATEIVMIGKRGSPPPPPDGFIGLLSPNLQHSRKPDSIYEYAEACPAPRLELFARRQRAGWHVFGNEIAGSITLEQSDA